MLGEGNARIYNLISIVFVVLSVLWVLIVLAQLISG